MTNKAECDKRAAAAHRRDAMAKIVTHYLRFPYSSEGVLDEIAKLSELSPEEHANGVFGTLENGLAEGWRIEVK